MVNISQTFVTYHGCGNGYLDGTRKIVPKNRKCIRATHYPFWKKAIDVRNSINKSANQIKTEGNKRLCKKIYALLECFLKRIF